MPDLNKATLALFTSDCPQALLYRRTKNLSILSICTESMVNCKGSDCIVINVSVRPGTSFDVDQPMFFPTCAGGDKGREGLRRRRGQGEGGAKEKEGTRGEGDAGDVQE